MVRLSINAKKVNSIFSKVKNTKKNIDSEDLSIKQNDFLRIAKGVTTTNSIFKAISYILNNATGFNVDAKKNYIQQIDQLCIKANNSTNDRKRGYLTEILLLNQDIKKQYGEILEFRFLPSKAQRPSRGESLYQHSGYYLEVMSIEELATLQFRQNCQCGLEVVNA